MPTLFATAFRDQCTTASFTRPLSIAPAHASLNLAFAATAPVFVAHGGVLCVECAAPKKGGKEPDEDRLHVVVRIRPPVRADEKFGEGSEALQVDKERNLLWLLSKDEEGGKQGSTKQYVFDRVLWKDSQQARGSSTANSCCPC